MVGIAYIYGTATNYLLCFCRLAFLQIITTYQTLKKEHMAQRLSETQSRNPSIQNGKDDSFNNEETKSELPEPANPEYKDPQCRISMGEEEKQSSIKDLEKGEDSTNMRGIDPPAGKDEEEKNLKYTHVIIPFPGHDVNGNDACNPVESTEESSPKKQTKIRMFGGRNNKVNEELNEAETTKECVEKNTATSKEEKKCKAEVRDVPIFCAICLMEYEISERICWASNPECTHVFHEDCVTQWLISLGRTKSKMQRFSMNPSEKELLNYQLECPCCRQDFIMKSATPEQCGDDAV